MTAQRTVTGAVVAVEADMLFEEEAKSALALAVPMRRPQHRAKDAGEAGVLVAGDAASPATRTPASPASLARCCGRRIGTARASALFASSSKSISASTATTAPVTVR